MPRLRDGRTGEVHQLPTADELNAALGKVVTIVVARKGDLVTGYDEAGERRTEDLAFTGRLFRWSEDGEAVLDPQDEFPHVASVPQRSWVWPALEVERVCLAGDG